MRDSPSLLSVDPTVFPVVQEQAQYWLQSCMLCMGSSGTRTCTSGGAHREPTGALAELVSVRMAGTEQNGLEMGKAENLKWCLLGIWCGACEPVLLSPVSPANWRADPDPGSIQVKHFGRKTSIADVVYFIFIALGVENSRVLHMTLSPLV